MAQGGPHFECEEMSGQLFNLSENLQKSVKEGYCYLSPMAFRVFSEITNLGHLSWGSVCNKCIVGFFSIFIISKSSIILVLRMGRREASRELCL